MNDLLRDDGRSLEQLENDYWPAIEFPSNLVANCHAYRKIPLKNLSIEQVRLLISQEIGLKHLVPLAISILSNNILAEGDLYEGDLLISVVGILGDFWEDNLKQRDMISNLIEDNFSILTDNLSAKQIAELNEFLRN